MRALFTVCCIVLPIFVIITWLHYSSISYLFQELPNFNNILSEKSQKVTAVISKEADPAIAVKVKDQRITLEPEDNSSAGPTRVDDEDNQQLHGLDMASTFNNEGSCLSRCQSHFYRKSSLHKPSSPLKSKLRHYEHLHTTCSPSFSFIRNHYTNPNNSTIKHDADHSTNCRYLIWSAMDGLGNRILSLVSAFLYAVLTDRVLLVKFESDMGGLFCEPFPNSSWLLSPRDFPDHWEDDGDQEHKESSTHHRPVLHLRHTNDDHYDFFHCGSTQDLLQKVPVLILQSNQYFVPSLFTIPSFRKDLTEMFPEKDVIFHLLGHYLLHPSNVAWKFIRNFYQTHLAMANQKIGLQIRVFDTHREPHQVVLNKIIACVSKNNLLPQSDKQIIPVTNSPSLSQNYTSKAVLVISLYSEYGDKIKAMYMANTSVTNGEVIRVYLPSHEEHQNSNDNKHNMKAWTEMYLLSLCDVLVTSSYSTFGYVAQSLGGLKPWILNRTFGGEEVPSSDPPCVRAMSMDPCFHYPPKRDCSSNTIANITSLFPHTVHCEDFGNGVKLIN
ncbi:galactoside 2-alpha-L-fucosyltransferase-like [Prosopis cineraria]|uniref:galactoside 2-alpha-L-fucosyltransferase-like n=1 Tax=Prosopis cineraria TaxID=364024 RepID=UPI00241026AE|nr:galactoside 2-alpha-L-fucosyltransferase-like [Prosopis cineraria]